MKTLILALILATLLGCSSGGGDNPTNAFQEFRIVNPLIQGTFEESAFSGSDSNGGAITGFRQSIVKPETVIAGQATIPVEILISVSINGGLSVGTNGVQFYSATSNQLLAYVVDIETYVGVNITNVPTEALIGDSGHVGTYESDLGYTDTQTWRLSDAGNGNAYLTVTNETFDDVLNSRYSTSVERRLINSIGTVLSYSVNVTLYQNEGYTFTIDSL